VDFEPALRPENVDAGVESCSRRPGLHVVCLVVLIVVARVNASVISSGAAIGAGVHLTPSFLGGRRALGRRMSLSRD